MLIKIQPNLPNHTKKKIIERANAGKPLGVFLRNGLTEDEYRKIFLNESELPIIWFVCYTDVCMEPEKPEDLNTYLKWIGALANCKHLNGKSVHLTKKKLEGDFRECVTRNTNYFVGKRATKLRALISRSPRGSKILIALRERNKFSFARLGTEEEVRNLANLYIQLAKGHVPSWKP